MDPQLTQNAFDEILKLVMARLSHVIRDPAPCDFLIPLYAATSAKSPSGPTPETLTLNPIL